MNQYMYMDYLCPCTYTDSRSNYVFLNDTVTKHGSTGHGCNSEMEIIAELTATQI